jgi:hypothetical protein
MRTRRRSFGERARASRPLLCPRAPRARGPGSARHGALDHVPRGLGRSLEADPLDTAVRPARGYTSTAGGGVSRARTPGLAGVPAAVTDHGMHRAVRRAAGGTRQRARPGTPRLGTPQPGRRLPDRPLGEGPVAAAAGRRAVKRRPKDPRITFSAPSPQDRAISCAARARRHLADDDSPDDTRAPGRPHPATTAMSNPAKLGPPTSSPRH